MRPGYDVPFPATDYVAILRHLEKKKMARYEDLRVAAKTVASVFGVKLKRLASQDLIVKESRGLYSITPLGLRVLKGYDAYVKIVRAA